MAYTKSELLNDISEKAGVSKADVERVIDTFFGTVVERAKTGDKVSWPGFGSFNVTERAARAGRNPQTGEEIQIAAANIPTFKAGKGLKDSVN